MPPHSRSLATDLWFRGPVSYFSPTLSFNSIPIIKVGNISKALVPKCYSIAMVCIFLVLFLFYMFPQSWDIMEIRAGASSTSLESHPRARLGCPLIPYLSLWNTHSPWISPLPEWKPMRLVLFTLYPCKPSPVSGPSRCKKFSVCWSPAHWDNWFKDGEKVAPCSRFQD